MSARDLYQELILDHAQRPHHYGPLEDANIHTGKENLSCGDDIRLHLRVEDGRILAVRFESEGCALSKASASMMTDVIDGRTVEEAHAAADQVRTYLMGKGELTDEALEDFEAFAGVRQLPTRVKCVALAWVALEEALGKTFT
jgi:nitrogen fixation NifU-like protein